MSAVAGVGELARLSVRRDRVLVLVWMLVLVAVCYASAAATSSLYPTEADRVAAARSINASPAVVALYGPILDVRSVGELSMTKMTVLYAVFVAILAVVVVRRHTRAEEESGRAELLGGTAIGRDALLVAAVSEGVVVSVLVGVLGGLAAVAGGLPAEGSAAFGASWVGIGLVGTGVAALACQLSASARTCGALAAAFLAVLFVLRAVGDTTSLSWLSWTSPFGWSTQLRAWSVAAVVGAAAVRRRGRRPRRLERTCCARGATSARASWRTAPARLTARLASPTPWRSPCASTRPSLATWTGATVVLGLVMGAIAPNIGDMLSSPSAQDLVRRLGGIGALQDTLLAAELSIMAVVVTCFAITVVTHSGADEHDGRTEQVLATATSRARAYVAVLVVALLGRRLAAPRRPGWPWPSGSAAPTATSAAGWATCSRPLSRRRRPCGWSPRWPWPPTPCAAAGRPPAGCCSSRS